MATKHAGLGCREEVKEVEGSLATLKTSLCKPVPLPPTLIPSCSLALVLAELYKGPSHSNAHGNPNRYDALFWKFAGFSCSFSNFPPRKNLESLRWHSARTERRGFGVGRVAPTRYAALCVKIVVRPRKSHQSLLANFQFYFLDFLRIL